MTVNVSSDQILHIQTDGKYNYAFIAELIDWGVEVVYHDNWTDSPWVLETKEGK